MSTALLCRPAVARAVAEAARARALQRARASGAGLAAAAGALLLTRRAHAASASTAAPAAAASAALQPHASPTSSSSSSSSATFPAAVVVYQYEACPFCNKLRAYLDYTRTPYVLVEVDPLFKGELAWSRDYKKVPVAVVGGRRVTDSGRIIAELEEARRARAAAAEEAGGAAGAGALYRGGGGGGGGGGVFGGGGGGGGAFSAASTAPPPAGAVGDGSEAERRLLAWCDERWVRLLTVNIYRSQRESLQAFEYMTRRNFHPLAAEAAKWFGALVHAHLIQGRLKARLGVADERAALFAAADEWAAALGGRAFLGGARPNLADLAVFGTLRAIDGLDASRDLLAEGRAGGGGGGDSGRAFAEWVGRMRGAVGGSALLHRVFEAPAGGMGSGEAAAVAVVEATTR